MIKRIYVNNFHCLTNFEFTTGEEESILLLGKNGTGKSSLREVLSILQEIARGKNLEITRQDYGFAGTKQPIQFEIDVEVSQYRFSYSIVIEYPDTFQRPRIKAEKLLANGEVCFSRDIASITLKKATFSLDWHIAALPIIQAKSDDPVSIFRKWLKDMLLLAPVPAQMKGSADENTEQNLNLNAGNFVSWLSGILRQYPSFYGDIAQYMKELFPDFSRFIFPEIGKTVKLILFFEKDESSIEIPFEKLSDGEKLLFLSGAVIATAKNSKNTFCFWDEPNNYISSSEMDQFVQRMRIGFSKNAGQLWVISHNIELISGFNDDNSWIFRRNGHTGATLPPVTIAGLRNAEKFTGDLNIGLQTGDIYDVE